jgi:glycine oxidase
VAPQFPLLRAARDLWPELAGVIGLPLDTEGALVIAAPDELDSLAARLTALGADFRPTSRDELVRRVPWLSSARPAIWTPDDWRLSPLDALSALRAAAQTSGARWMSASVVRFESGRAYLSDGDFMDCDTLVIATGASRSLTGLAHELDLLSPIKGQILRWPNLALSGPVVRLNGAYICPSARGVTVGATMEPGREDLDIDPSAVAILRDTASAVVPALAGGPVQARAGVRAATPDGLPLVGPASRPGIWLAVGARRNGWLLAPLIARITADGLAGAAADRRSAAFDPARFF